MCQVEVHGKGNRHSSSWIFFFYSFVLLQVKDILRPFKVSTVALSTDKYPTASAVLPMKHVLLSHLRQETDGDTAALKEMKAKITADLNKRYPEDGDVFMFLNTASYLDPRFHCLGHLDHGRQHEVHAKVLAEITAIATAEKSGEGSELPAPPEAPFLQWVIYFPKSTRSRQELLNTICMGS